MRSLLFIILLCSSITVSCQNGQTQDKNSIKEILAEFLVSKKIIKSIEDYSNNTGLIKLQGVYKGIVNDNLKDGIYVFSINRTHNKVFFLS